MSKEQRRKFISFLNSEELGLNLSQIEINYFDTLDKTHIFLKHEGEEKEWPKTVSA